MFYLYGIGYRQWLYNPVLYQLWTPSDLSGEGSHLARILVHRIYCLAISVFLLALALLFFERKTTKGLVAQGRMTDKGLALLVTVISLLVAGSTGFIISSGI
jgi:hypothetical protein